jgi:hypothetical protein
MEKVFLGVIAGAADERVIRTVRAVVDFVSFARFEVHTEKSLDKLDKAWSAIHENKSIFVELGIRTHFNMPKFHSLIHYVSSVHTHGTLDGYNTESPERLHIDETFLRWAKGEGLLENESEESGDDGDEVGSKRKRRQNDGNVEVSGTHDYKVAKSPGYGNVSIDDLINKFGAADEWFTWYLEDFLIAHSLPIPASHDVPFGVFKRVSVTLPQIPQVSDKADLRDTIRTTFPEPPQNRRKAIPAQFDTVLAFEKPGLTAFTDPSNPLKGTFLQHTCPYHRHSHVLPCDAFLAHFPCPCHWQPYPS